MFVLFIINYFLSQQLASLRGSVFRHLVRDFYMAVTEIVLRKLSSVYASNTRSVLLFESSIHPTLARGQCT